MRKLMEVLFKKQTIGVRGKSEKGWGTKKIEV